MKILSLDKKLIFAGIAIMVLGSLVFWSAPLNLKGYSTLSKDCQTATATSTRTLQGTNYFYVPNLKWLTPGTGTTTLDCAVASKTALKVLMWQVASSSQTTYKVAISYSMDSVDFYERAGSLLESQQNSTTTQLVNNSVLQLSFASSTIEASQDVGFYGTGTTTAKKVAFDIPTLGANMVRLTFYLGNSPATSTNGAFYAEGVGTELRGN